MNDFHPWAFMLVKVLVRSIFGFDQVPEHDEELSSGVILLVGLEGFFDELDELRMLDFEEFGDSDTLDFVNSVEFVFAHTVEVKVKVDDLSGKSIIFLFGSGDIKVLVLVWLTQDSFEVVLNHEEDVFGRNVRFLVWCCIGMI